MRNLIIRLVLWLCRLWDINPVDQTRQKGTADAVVRGQRWEAFYREEGGLADMIGTVRRQYFEAAGACGVADTDKLYEYALADRLARELEREVLQIIVTGKAKAEELAARERAKSARLLRSI